MQRSIVRVSEARATPEGDGMIVHRAFPGQAIGRIDPFLMLDEMGPIVFEAGARSGFPDHPHRGFETVTYLLDGEFEHKDSNGNKGRLGPGDVQWMTAGAGVVHSEMPSASLRKEGGRLHGFQLWVNLPKKDKMMTPRYQEFPGARIPEVKVAGATVKVVAGQFENTNAVIDTRTPIQYFHVRLEPNATLELPTPDGHQGFLYVVHGAATVGDKELGEHGLGLLSAVGRTVTVNGGAEGAEFLLVTGMPINEPVFQYGPFVMTTREEIIEAVEDFQAGKFGVIPATH